MTQRRHEIPNKLYFRIGEVSEIVGVKPYVLRYWESEFPDVKPAKSKSGQRLYKRRDVEVLVKIKGLLYEERFTINGARRRLKEWMRDGGATLPTSEPRHQLEAFIDEDVEERPERGGRRVPPAENRKALVKIRRDLESLLKIIRP